MRTPRAVVNLWRRVASRYGSNIDVLFGSCCSKSLEDFCNVGFVSSVMLALSFVQAKGLVQFSLTFECIRVAKYDYKHYLFSGSI